MISSAEPGRHKFSAQGYAGMHAEPNDHSAHDPSGVERGSTVAAGSAGL